MNRNSLLFSTERNDWSLNFVELLLSKRGSSARLRKGGRGTQSIAKCCHGTFDCRKRLIDFIVDERQLQNHCWGIKWLKLEFECFNDFLGDYAQLMNNFNIFNIRSKIVWSLHQTLVNWFNFASSRFLQISSSMVLFRALIFLHVPCCLNNENVYLIESISFLSDPLSFFKGSKCRRERAIVIE